MKHYTLKALRANANFTQLEVAERMGISPTTWSKWENKKRFPTIEQATKISEIFGVPFDEIIFL